MPTFHLAEQVFSALPTASQRGAPLALLAIHGHSGPRWIVPGDGSPLGPILAAWSPYRLSSRIQWHVVRAANRVGMLKTLPYVETIRLQNENAIDWRALGWYGPDEPLVSVYIGTSGPTQKAVLHLVSRKSLTCAAIVKVPLATQAKSAIVREAATLSALAEEQ